MNAWGVIRYGYKSPLVFVKGTSKKGAFKQKDYLAQVLEAYIQPILEDFATVIYVLRPSVELLFMENRNSAYGYKNTSNCYAR
jgi:hypothetical protein